MKQKPDILQYQSYRDYLRDYIEYARAKKASWSFSVWARQLDLQSKSTLVMIVQGKRHPGAQLVERLSEHLQFNDTERSHFERLVESEKKVLDPVTRLVFMRGTPEQRAQREQQRRQWLTLVLLDLCGLPDFKEDPQWIKSRLLVPIDESEITKTLSQMIELGFLVRNEKGSLRPASQSVQQTAGGTLTPDEISRFHEDGAQASIEALMKVDRTLRVFMTSILQISESRLPEAAEILQQAQKDLSRILQTTDGESVYELHLHLFPLTRKLEAASD